MTVSITNQHDFMYKTADGTYEYPYAKPSMTADVIFIAMNSLGRFEDVLLIKRKNEPFKDCWAFPGGFVNIEEELKTAALRELKEETGIEPVSIKIFTIADSPYRDPRDRVISAVFVAHAGGIKPKVVPADDAIDYKWYSIRGLKESALSLAFDHLSILQQYASVWPGFTGGSPSSIPPHLYNQ